MKIQAKFYPDVDIKDLEWGTISETTWQRLHTDLERHFNIKENERLVGITVSELGIKAKIEYLDGTENIRAIPKPSEKFDINKQANIIALPTEMFRGSE